MKRLVRAETYTEIVFVSPTSNNCIRSSSHFKMSQFASLLHIARLKIKAHLSQGSGMEYQFPPGEGGGRKYERGCETCESNNYFLVWAYVINGLRPVQFVPV